MHMDQLSLHYNQPCTLISELAISLLHAFKLKCHNSVIVFCGSGIGGVPTGLRCNFHNSYNEGERE